MKVLKNEKFLSYELEAEIQDFARDYSEVLEKHADLISRASQSSEMKNLLKKEILSRLVI